MTLAAITLMAAAQNPALPQRADVEGALQWDYGRLCRNLIDHCLDADGNDLYQTPEYAVSRLRCRPVAPRRAACSFRSVRRFRPNSAEPGQRCTGTLQRRDHEIGGASWTFIIPDPRRPDAVLLSCN